MASRIRGQTQQTRLPGEHSTSRTWSAPGCCTARSSSAEHAHARIRHIDISRAERLPGVRAVITAYNTPELRIGFLRDNFALKRDGVRQTAATKSRPSRRSIPDIAAEAVEADSGGVRAVARRCSLRRRRSPKARHWFTKPTRGQAAQRQSACRSRAPRSRASWRPRGAVEHIAEGQLFHAAAYSRVAWARPAASPRLDVRGNLTIWAKTQIPFLAQRDFNRALPRPWGCRAATARVIVPVLGGGFGTGLDTHAYEYIAILLAHRTGQAGEDRVHARGGVREPVAAAVRSRAHRAWVRRRREAHVPASEVLQDNGAYTSWGATYPTVMMLPATSLYRVPAVRFDAQLVYTNNTYCQAMRGYGNPEVTWPIESNLDELAEAAGIDPSRCACATATNPARSRRWASRSRRVVSVSAYRRRAQAGLGEETWQTGSTKRGVGLASLIHVGGSGRIYRSDGGGVILKLDDYGNVNVSYGGVEMGQGLHAALTVTVADALGVRPEKVIINQTDTATCPWDVGTHASRGAFIGCNAAIMAAKKVRKKLFTLATEVFPAARSGGQPGQAREAAPRLPRAKL